MSQAISATTATATQFGAAVKETKGDDLGKSDFLLLLVTQFKHQDPLNPMDDKEFVAQLSQFSSLEQLINLNSSMDGLTTATREQQLMNASSYIGKDVAAAGSSVGKLNGKISAYHYAFGDTMSKGTINVYDPNGQLVYSEELGSHAAGQGKFIWSGLRYDGAVMPDGVYIVRLSCLDVNGQPMLTDSMVTGTVSGVTNSNGTLYLNLSDGRTVALADVRELASAGTIDKADEIDKGAATQDKDSQTSGSGAATQDSDTATQDNGASAGNRDPETATS